MLRNWVLFSFWFLISLTILGISFCLLVKFPCCEIERADLMGEVWKWLSARKVVRKKSSTQVQCIIISLNRNFLDVQISGLFSYAAVTDLDFIYTKEKKSKNKKEENSQHKTKRNYSNMNSNTVEFFHGLVLFNLES